MLDMKNRIKTHQDMLMNPPQRSSSFSAVMPDEEYGVSHDGDEVTLHLGMVAPFSLPKDQAIKLAVLILRHAGVEVNRG